MSKSMATEFALSVVDFIRRIPKGRVATYSQIAALAGKPGAARGVSWILHSSSKSQGLPWHRVVNSKGGVSFPKGSADFGDQMRLLKKEGLLISAEGSLDLERWQWRPKAHAAFGKKTPARKTLSQMKLEARQSQHKG